MLSFEQVWLRYDDVKIESDLNKWYIRVIDKDGNQYVSNRFANSRDDVDDKYMPAIKLIPGCSYWAAFDTKYWFATGGKRATFESMASYVGEITLYSNRIQRVTLNKEGKQQVFGEGYYGTVISENNRFYVKGVDAKATIEAGWLMFPTLPGSIAWREEEPALTLKPSSKPRDEDAVVIDRTDVSYKPNAKEESSKEDALQKTDDLSSKALKAASNPQDALVKALGQDIPKRQGSALDVLDSMFGGVPSSKSVQKAQPVGKYAYLGINHDYKPLALLASIYTVARGEDTFIKDIITDYSMEDVMENFSVSRVYARILDYVGTIARSGVEFDDKWQALDKCIDDHALLGSRHFPDEILREEERSLNRVFNDAGLGKLMNDVKAVCNKF